MHRYCVSTSDLTTEGAAFHTSAEHRPEHIPTMASTSREDVPTVQPRQQVSDNSFSIKNILNIPEEPRDECAQVLNREENCPMFGFPIVPQVIRPVAQFNMEGALSPMYNTTQWLSAARHFPPWLLGTCFMRFLPGK